MATERRYEVRLGVRVPASVFGFSVGTLMAYLGQALGNEGLQLEWLTLRPAAENEDRPSGQEGGGS